MNGHTYITEKQEAWAKRRNLDLVGSQGLKGRRGYTATLNDNLFKPLLPDVEQEIENGDGNELSGESTKLPNMHALHSSSALCVNFFQYWKNKSLSDLSFILSLCRNDNKLAKEIKFEQKFEICKDFTTPPNIDAVIYNQEDSNIKAYGVECKFSEPYSSFGHDGLKKRYLTDITPQWKYLPNLKKLGEEISPNDKRFEKLHAAQLIKHILGLKKAYGKKGFRLLYLWYDVLGTDGDLHRTEIEEFSRIAKMDDILFHAISYQEVILKLMEKYYSGNEEYVDYLTERYL